MTECRVATYVVSTAPTVAVRFFPTEMVRSAPVRSTSLALTSFCRSRWARRLSSSAPFLSSNISSLKAGVPSAAAGEELVRMPLRVLLSGSL